MSRLVSALSITRRFSSKASYFHQPGKKPLVYRNLGQQLRISATKYTNKDAIVAYSEGKRITYSELDEQVSRLAAGYLKLGLQPGDRVAIWGPNHVHWVISTLAAARSGLITAGINPNFQASEVKYALNRIGAKALITSESHRNTKYYAVIEQMIPEIRSCDPGKLRSNSVPSLKTVIIDSNDNYNGVFKFCDIMDFPNRADIDSLEKSIDNISPDAACNIQFTSGTTGLPKATLVSHNSIVNTALFYRKALGLEGGTICGILPLFHCYALFAGMIASFTCGASYILASPYFMAEKALRTIVAENCTHLQGTPTMYVDIMEKQKELKLPVTSLKNACVGGSSSSAQLIMDIKNILKVPSVQNAYGASETSASAFIVKLDETGDNILNTVGTLNDHLEAKIIDGNGKIVPFGQPGELCIRGFNTMIEYSEDEESTRKVLDKDKWYKTGDQFVLTEDGYGIVVGRIKDIIIRGGENIFPKEIEDFLNTHPDIIESHVIGVPDKRLGEELCAFVRVGAGANLNIDGLKEYSKGKIAYFKIPRYLRIVQQFPKTTSGKIQKFKLKEMFEKE